MVCMCCEGLQFGCRMRCGRAVSYCDMQRSWSTSDVKTQDAVQCAMRRRNAGDENLRTFTFYPSFFFSSYLTLLLRHLMLVRHVLMLPILLLLPLLSLAHLPPPQQVPGSHPAAASQIRPWQTSSPY